MKQLTRSEFNKQGTTYKSVTSPATDDQVTQITDIVESNGNLAYSVDGSNFKTITNEIQKVDDVSEIYPSANALPILGQSDDGVVYGALTNGELPLKLYKYNASDSSWEYIDQAKDNVLYLDGETGLIYEFKSVSPYFFVTSYTKTSQLANDSGFVTQSDINAAVSAEATARQTADATLQNNIDAKQDELTAGSNITIENNVISATVPQIAVDSALSTTSENPVQNKIVTGAINGKMNSTNPTGTGSFSMNRAAGSSVGNNSVAVGTSTTSRGEASFAEGSATQAWGAASHAEGMSTFATAQSSHSEGQSTQATGQAAHAEGFGTTASNAYSHAEGQGTHTSATAQHVFGKYNKNNANCVEIVGNGTGNTNATSSNARTLDWSGNEVLAGTSTATGFIVPNGTSSEFLKADGSTDSTTYATSSDLTTGLSNKQDTLSTAQLNAVNSGITSSLVSQISTNQTNIANEVTARESADTTLQQNINAKYTKPSAGIPASDLVQAVVDSLNLANTALQNGSDVVTALGYTPYDATNPNGYTKVEASSTNGNIKINGSETNVYTLPGDIATDGDVSAVQSNLNAEITAREGADTTLQNNINTINGKIPTQASTTNQLADKDFVNSSINAFAAYYITKNAAGDPFATKVELNAATTFYSGGVVRTPTTNDYCIVLADESKQSETGVDPTTRYSYQGGQWEYQYTVNDTPLTAAQLAALNSGATSTNIAQISTNASNITDLQNNKQNNLTTAQLNAVNSGVTSSTVSQVATNASNITSLQSGKQDKLAASSLSYYGTCATAAATQAKVVDCTGFVLETGVSIRVKFTNAQTYNGAPTLNINGTGAKSVKSVGTTNSARYCWLAGEVVDFVYDGTNYIMVDGGLATTTYYGYTKLTSSATSTNTSTALTPAPLNNVMQNIVTGYPVYSATSTYAVGDRVRYSWYVYECNTAITTAEAWTAAHWTQVEDLQSQIDNKQDELSASQLSAVNSGITSTSVAQIGTNQSNIASLQTSKQNAITSSAKLSADLVDDTNTTNKFVTSTEKTTWNGKQNALTFDSTPTQDSINPVTSGGVYTALTEKQNNLTAGTGISIQNDTISSDVIGITEITSTPIRIYGMAAGVYKINVSGTVDIYYNGQTSTDSLSLSFRTRNQNYLIVSHNSDPLAIEYGWELQFDGNIYVGVTTGSSGNYHILQRKLTAGTNITIDANNVISAQTSATVTVDDALSTTSENPVQNKVVTSALNGKQGNITSTNKLSADLVDDSSSTNKFVTSAEKSTWNGKQNAITSTNKLDYSLIANTPTIPTKTSELTNDSGFGSGTVKSVNNTSPDANGNVSITIPTDTGATSITTTGSGNAVTTASYDASTRQITLTKGSTFLTSAPVTSVSGRTGAVTTANLITDMLTGAASKGDKIASKSMGASGYITFSSGLKIAWGVANHGSSAYDWTINISFGITFTNNPTVASTPLEASGSGCWSYVYRTLSTTGCTLRQTSKPNANGKAQYIYWIAIGY